MNPTGQACEHETENGDVKRDKLFTIVHSRLWTDVRNKIRMAWNHPKIRMYALLVCLGGVVGLVSPISPALVLIAIFGAAFFATAFSRPILLCYLIIAAIALLSGMQRGRLVPLLTPNEATLLASVYILLIITLARKRRNFHISGYYAAAFISLVGGTVVIPVLAFLVKGTPLTITNGFKLVAPVQYFLLFLVFNSLPQNEKDRRKLIQWMLVCSSIVAAVGLLQAVGAGFVTRLLEIFYASSHETMARNAGRVTSLLGAWNSLGMFMMFNFLMGWSILQETNESKSRIVTMTSMTLCGLCLVASGSYAGLIGLVIGLVIIETQAKRKLGTAPILIIGSAVFFVALLFFEPLLQPLIERRLAYQYRYGGVVPETLLYRFKVWQNVFIPPIIKSFPWPVFPSVPTYYTWQNEESQYVLLLFRTGLSGLIGHLAWVGITIGWLARIHRQSSGFTDSMATAALAIIIVLSIAGFTNEVFSFAGSADYLWITLALIANSKEKSSWQNKVELQRSSGDLIPYPQNTTLSI
jgi:hypothetical protein